jgi:hypothetical protein
MNEQSQFELPMSFGTDPRKLHRRESIDTSIEAAHAVDTTKLEELVLRAVYSAGIIGAIQDDALRAFPAYPYSSITARFASLLEKKLIEDTGTRRAGRSGRKQRVVIATLAGAELLQQANRSQQA